MGAGSGECIVFGSCDLFPTGFSLDQVFVPTTHPCFVLMLAGFVSGKDLGAASSFRLLDMMGCRKVGMGVAQTLMETGGSNRAAGPIREMPWFEPPKVALSQLMPTKRPYSPTVTALLPRG